jgi:23S rRNA (cytidine1920-2'-O)/16S rRNA (cytidine1409-2'-O)-methyltransferase
VTKNLPANVTHETWQGETARLDRVLPELGLARSRSQAAELISSGRVSVNGQEVLKAGARVNAGSVVVVSGDHHYVSRGAQKLLAGLTEFEVSADGLVALDVGASTGGFTQVLLERGAQTVLAIDVGHNQLAESLRVDPRVRLAEGVNARDLTREKLASLTGVDEAPALVVADLSFISLELVLPAMVQVASPDADFIMLIKPQFEVGRQGISGGIVTDSARAVAAVERVIDCAHGLGLECRGVRLSPVTGEHGNTEVLAHFVRTRSDDRPEWRERIRAIFKVRGEA